MRARFWQTCQIAAGSIPAIRIRKPQNGGYMASENKKRKARNSYLYNGGDKCDKKMKRIMYFTKRHRNKNKKIAV